MTQRVIEHIIRSKPLDFADLNVNEIARRFQVTVPHLSRAFKAEKGICLKKFLLKEKIMCSRFLLIQDRRMTVKELAAALDFCSCDYFIRIFKEHVGMTPGQYRKLNGEFYGLNDRRKGLIDRRSGNRDRRQGSNAKKVSLGLNTQITPPHSGKSNHRTGLEDRRNGPRDRRHPTPITYHSA